MTSEDQDLKQQVQTLQVENEGLKREIEALRAQRKKHFDVLYASLDAQAPTEEEIAAGMHDRRPFSEFLAEHGIVPTNGKLLG
jgi:hypothetical protein